VYDDVPVNDLARLLRAGAASYRDPLLATPESVLRRRPGPTRTTEVWSALEYACHVRDVLLVQRDRAVLALVEANPGFPPMYRDERVALARYDAHTPARVADHLEMAADLCATVFDQLTTAQWARPLLYNYPVTAERDLAWLGRNTAHEVEHHLGDIRSVIAVVTGPGPGS
jgi:DinB superfamily